MYVNVPLRSGTTGSTICQLLCSKSNLSLGLLQSCTLYGSFPMNNWALEICLTRLISWACGIRLMSNFGWRSPRHPCRLAELPLDQCTTFPFFLLSWSDSHGVWRLSLLLPALFPVSFKGLSVFPNTFLEPLSLLDICFLEDPNQHRLLGCPQIFILYNYTSDCSTLSTALFFTESPSNHCHCSLN